MKRASDTEALIACLACAKAKAKCDKRLPTCSRCLLKQQKCESRQPRRYAESFRMVQSGAQSSASGSSALVAVSEPQPRHVTGSTIEQGVFSPELDFENTIFQNNFGPEIYQLTQTSINTAPIVRQPNPETMDQWSPPFSLGDTSLVHSLAFLQPEMIEQSQPRVSMEEDWPWFRCNPQTQYLINPRTGGEYLLRLVRTLDEVPNWRQSDFDATVTNSDFHLCSIPESVREKMTVIAQEFFRRAREVHYERLVEAKLDRKLSSGFFFLPPNFVLDTFFKAFACHVETYMPFFPGKIIDPESLIALHDKKLSVLHLLLMIADGAMTSALVEAHEFASGLLETCRLYIFDTMEKDVQLTAQPLMLRCALLYIHASAWSGNKWHMDLATAQLCIFTSMLKFARLLETRDSSLSGFDVMTEAETAWTKWRNEERTNRLIYSWIMLDQEVNLFHDHQPSLDVENIATPRPASECSWEAMSAQSWLNCYIDARQRELANLGEATSTPSLANLFAGLVNGELSNKAEEISWLELRLLLHPLQALIYHLNKTSSSNFRPNNQAHWQRFCLQVEEIQHLLKQWYDIAKQNILSGDNISYQGCCAMIVYHLISLNAVTYFPDIERLARGQISMAEFKESIWTERRYVKNLPFIWCHCGQILRYFRMLPKSRRPHWWSASIYRVALSLWATELAKEHISNKSKPKTLLKPLSVDTVPFHHPSIVRFLQHEDQIPEISHTDGSPAILNGPVDIIKLNIAFLDEQAPLSKFSQGIRTRLGMLVDRIIDKRISHLDI